jgi:hypothetical protein
VGTVKRHDGKVQTFTLDTGCIIAAVQQQEHAEDVERLTNAAREGQVTCWLTAAFAADQTRASSEYVRANRAWLAEQPILQVAPGAFRLDYSYLDGPDVLVSDQQAAVIEAIEDIVLPPKYRVGQLPTDDEQFMAKWNRKISDVQHLAAHHMAGHDAFVTGDHDDIVKRRDQLWERVRICVYTPGEAVEAIHSEQF